MIPELTPERIASMRAGRSAVKSAAGLLAKANLHRPEAEIAKIAKRLEDTPERMRRTYLRAVSGRSMAAGIKAFCAECVGWERAEVTRCTAPACPLYAYRPFVDRRKR
jgi:hypothetical protein